MNNQSSNEKLTVNKTWIKFFYITGFILLIIGVFILVTFSGNKYTEKKTVVNQIQQPRPTIVVKPTLIPTPKVTTNPVVVIPTMGPTKTQQTGPVDDPGYSVADGSIPECTEVFRVEEKVCPNDIFRQYGGLDATGTLSCGTVKVISGTDIQILPDDNLSGPLTTPLHCSYYSKEGK